MFKEKVTKEEKKSRLEKRAIELDILRGIAVLFMIFDHFMYDSGFLMEYLFEGYGYTGWSYDFSMFAVRYWVWDVRIIVRQIILVIFFSLTGICCSFSKNNLKRGLKLLVFAGLISLVTYFIGTAVRDINILISFGVLHCISLTLIIIGLLELFLKDKKWGKYLYLVAGIIMVALGIYFFKDCKYVSYNFKEFFSLFIDMLLGKRGAGSDYFPFLLYCGEAFIGVFLGKLLYSNRKSLFNWKYHNNPLTFIGRNSLLVYIAHQVLIPVILGIILLLCGFKFSLF